MAASRKDPYLSFRFLVEIEGLVVGGFSEVSGLQAETEVETVEEGGVNDRVHKLAKKTKYPNLILKHGITEFSLLWNWYSDVIRGKIKRKSVFIILLDSEGKETLRRNCVEAYPVKWSGPDMKADGNAVAVETVELVHSGLTRT